MGYYPTPPGVVERIGSFLSYPDEPVNLLDPCCGGGEALRSLAEGADARTYGIELDEHRAEQAQYILDEVLKCSYEDTRISHDAFSGLFLNPPYDWLTRDDEAGPSERTEGAFLSRTTPYLQSDGVLVYIIPQQRVTERIARLLAHRYGDLRAYRFPDKEYETFQQVTVFGLRKPEPDLDRGNLRRLRSIPGYRLDELPYLHTPMYPVPPARPVKLFQSTVIDEAGLERELAESQVWKQLREQFASRDGQVGNPPLPLHSGHLGLLLASGYLDGVVGVGEERHVVTGKVEKLSDTFEEYQGDTLVEREVERYQVSVKLLDQDGEIKTLT